MPRIVVQIDEQFKIAVKRAAKLSALPMASFVKMVIKERLNKMGIKIKVKVIDNVNKEGAMLDEWVARGYPLEDWVPVVRWVDED